MIVTQNGPQNIDQVKTFFESGDIFLSPKEYQRENAWDLDQKKLLIDSLFQGMDIPKLYFWKIDDSTLADGYPDEETKQLYKRILDRKRKENDDPDPNIFEVVDGQQRIRTILEFMGIAPPNENCYRGLWHEAYPSFSETPIAKGKLYNQLNTGQKIKFGQSPLTIMVLERAKIEEIRDMFLRLQNGTPLNAQQKRDAMGSKIGYQVKELVMLPFFSKSVNFENTDGDQHRVASQMLLLESNEKIVSCTSRKLDKFYKIHKSNSLEPSVVSRTKKTIKILGGIFREKNPALNRSYAIGLYWVISRLATLYEIPESEYSKIQENFEDIDQRRLEANNREYTEKGDDVLEELSQTMSRATDGLEGISDRYEILTQFLFEGVTLKTLTELDPNRLFSFEERLILWRRSKGYCQLSLNGKLCGRQIEFEDAVVDHIIPHSNGGKTELANGRISYKACNIARGNRDNFNPKVDCCKIDSTET